MTETKHTKVIVDTHGFIADSGPRFHAFRVYWDDGSRAAETSEEQCALAATIQRRYNAYDRLVSLLTEASNNVRDPLLAMRIANTLKEVSHV